MPRTGRATTRRAWHSRASRPVMMWMIALVLVVLAHPFLPQSRWLMVHMVTLGLITTSIMVWGQHFTEALLKTRLAAETRGRQTARIWLLTLGVVAAVIGMPAGLPWLVVVGALIISTAIVWYAAALGRQLRAAIAPRFGFTVKAYIGAACLLPVGAVLGAILSFSPGEPWQGRLLLAHLLVNVLGFVGVTVVGTLLTLWPTVLHTRLDPHAASRAARGCSGMLVCVIGAGVGALTGSSLVGIVFVAGYAASFLLAVTTLVTLAIHAARTRRRAPLPMFPVLSIGAGVIWFAVVLAALAVMWVGSANSPAVGALLAADVQRLTLPAVAGFLLQVLLGAMSHLLPVTMGGGPRAVRAALHEMSRFALFRVVAYNLALALFVVAGLDGPLGRVLYAALTLGIADVDSVGSLSRVLISVLGLIILLSFIVLMLRAVRARKQALADTSPSRPSRRSAPDEEAPIERRALTSALLGIGSVLGVTAIGSALDRTASFDVSAGSGGGDAGGRAGGTDSGSGVSATGRTTTIAVSMADMRFTPDVLEVPAGDALVIELSNDDPSEVHDLVLESGTDSGRLQPGESATVNAGVIGADLDGWCSIVGHRSMGMTLLVHATGSGSDAAGNGQSSAEAADELTPVTADLQAAPGDGYTVRDAAIPDPVDGGQRLRLEVTSRACEVAPGVVMDAMTYNGTVVGPVIRSSLGARLTVELVNSATHGHSLDLHAGHVSPDEPMRTIPPGERLDYAITTDHAGIWLYHCSTAPMSVHLAAGMAGALIVPPAGLADVDREYVLVQTEHYLVPDGAPGLDDAEHDGARPVSPAKIAAGRPDLTVFNGHATQYVHAPLSARVGERVRIWVLAAGPSRGISFHVVGGIFDTVFKEGVYLLRPDAETGGGAQVLDLASAQGGFVELVFDEPGTYTAVNHSFAEMERGARALIRVSA